MLTAGFNAPPPQQDIARCQRYFEKSYKLEVNPGTVTDEGIMIEFATRAQAAFTQGPFFRVEKRAEPTMTIYASGTGNSGNVTNNGDKVASADVSSVSQSKVGWLNITSGDTANQATYHWTADARLT